MLPGTGAMPASARSTADHRKFKALQQTFKTGPEVTAACLSCHTEAANQVQHTKHWTWKTIDTKTNKTVGKRAIINNYCTTTISNERDCMACHAGYGWQDEHFDFNKPENVDCLVCHDSTGSYRKLPGDAGHPIYERREFPAGSGKFVEAIDLQKVAQNVALPSRSNCGSCHFYGAGGDERGPRASAPGPAGGERDGTRARHHAVRQDGRRAPRARPGAPPSAAGCRSRAR